MQNQWITLKVFKFEVKESENLWNQITFTCVNGLCVFFVCIFSTVDAFIIQICEVTIIFIYLVVINSTSIFYLLKKQTV